MERSAIRLEYIHEALRIANERQFLREVSVRAIKLLIKKVSAETT